MPTVLYGIDDCFRKAVEILELPPANLFKSPEAHLIAIVFTTAIIAVAEPQIAGDHGPQGSLLAPQAIVVGVLLFSWCKAHAKQAGIEEPAASATMCGLFTIIGVLLYFFRAFGFAQGGVKSLKAIAFVLLLALCDVVSREFGGYISS